MVLVAEVARFRKNFSPERIRIPEFWQIRLHSGIRITLQSHLNSSLGAHPHAEHTSDALGAVKLYRHLCSVHG